MFFLFAVIGKFVRRKSKIARLVLTKFNVDSTLESDFPIDIQGRAPGLISWFLHLLRIDPRTKLKLSKKEVIFSETSLSGESNWFIPFKSVSATSSGYYKPWGVLVFGGFVLLSGIVSSIITYNSYSRYRAFDFTYIIIGVLIAVICFFAYRLNKRINIVIESKGGRLFGITFKASFIENVSVDLESSKQVIEIIRKMTN